LKNLKYFVKVILFYIKNKEQKNYESIEFIKLMNKIKKQNFHEKEMEKKYINKKKWMIINNFIKTEGKNSLNIPYELKCKILKYENEEIDKNEFMSIMKELEVTIEHDLELDMFSSFIISPKYRINTEFSNEKILLLYKNIFNFIFHNGK
jgi:antitoxin component of MazEF toxin-antitoxin module